MTIWSNPACDALLRRSIEDGHTYRQLTEQFADELGIHVGRNALVGRAFRLGLTVPKPKKPKKEKPPRQIRSEPEPSPPAAPPLEILGVSLWDLRTEHCRYPNHDASLYCGAPKANGSSYCEAHHRICYIKSYWRA